MYVMKLKNIVLMSLMILLVSGTQAQARKILVPPFQNLSKAKSMISYEVATSSDPNNPKRSFRVDQYSEAPREILEDIILGIDGVEVVERQRIDSLLLEMDLGRFSGLVDVSQAVQIGKMLGADSVIMGSILYVRTRESKFSGYGIKTKNITVECSIRIRLIDIESSRVSYSKMIKGGNHYPSSSFGGIKDSDIAFSVIESTLEQLYDDDNFKQGIRGDNARNNGGTMMDIQFIPIPDNCDIEIDGLYVGGSPLTYSLQAGKQVQIRISKPGFQVWERTIIPNPNLIVKPELLRLSNN